MKGKRFVTIEEIRDWLAIPKSEFQKSLEDWKIGWHKRIISEGGYFIEDKLVTDK